MLQLTLDISHEPEYYSEDFFVTNANIEAFRATQNPKLWPDKRILIVGDEGSGKTHLCSVLSASYPKSLVCENIENWDEEELFHQINQAANSGNPLLLTTARLPSFKLRDLQSRINATHKILLKPADEFLLRVILRKQFSDRQIKIREGVLDYILTHYERSYKAIKDLVLKLDDFSLASKRHITIPLVKSFIAGS